MVLSVLLFLDFPLHMTDFTDHKVVPSMEAHSKEHLGQEGVCSRRLELREEVLFLDLRVVHLLFLGLHGNLNDAELGHEFIQGHDTVEVDLAILCTH